MVLKVFQIFRGDVGYVQGMSQFAYVLHMVFRDEFQTFEYFAHMVLKRFPLFEFYSFDSVVVGNCAATVAHFASLHARPKSEATRFFVENMMETYVYSVFFTLFVGFFEEADLFVVLDLFVFQGHFAVLFMAILVVLQFAKTSPQSFNLGDLKAFTKTRGIAGLEAEASESGLRLQDVVKHWETHFAFKHDAQSVADSNDSDR